MVGELWITVTILIISFAFIIEGTSDGMDVFTIGNMTYFLSRDGVQRHDISKACQSMGLEELYIESNEEFHQLRTWISDNPALDTAIMWIKTNNTGSTNHEWKNREPVSVDAWMVLASRGIVEPNGVGNRCENTECCVYASAAWGGIGSSIDGRHYLMDNICDQDLLYLCVEASPIETTTPTTTTSTSTTTTTTSASTTTTTTKSTFTTTTCFTTSQSMLSTSTPPNTSTLDAGCPCTCKTDVNMNPTQTELETMVEEIQKELTVSKTTLSSTRNKKESAPDDRPSSMSMGVFAISLTVLPLIFMLFLDLSRLFQFLSSSWNKHN